MLSQEYHGKISFGLDISKVLKKLGLESKRADNGDRVLKCTVHREKTPSLRYVSSKGIFFCFGCGYKRNLFGFVKDVLKTKEHRKVLRFFKKHFGVEPPQF